MGGLVSRISPDITFDHGINESFNRLKSSFDCTPKYKTIDDKAVDPRSATLEINRTPLCLLDLPEEEGKTPVLRNRKKSKRRASPKSSDTESSRSDIFSRSFEFASCAPENSEHLVLWEPRPLRDRDEPNEKVVAEETTNEKYENVVEELRECLNKVSVTAVYFDEDSEQNPPKLVSPPVNKELKKKQFWTPDAKSTNASPAPKERTPLGTVNSNTVSNRLNSSVHWHGGKMWRGPAEERAKLHGENTPPPALPPFGSPRSAPPSNRHLHFSLK